MIDNMPKITDEMLRRSKALSRSMDRIWTEWESKEKQSKLFLALFFLVLPFVSFFVTSSFLYGFEVGFYNFCAIVLVIVLGMTIIVNVMVAREKARLFSIIDKYALEIIRINNDALYDEYDID